MSHWAGAWRKLAIVVVATVAVGFTLPGSTVPAGATTDPLESLTASSTWLETLNAWRAASQLAPVTEDTTFSAGDLAHSKYMVENGAFGHTEDMNLPFATPEGALAGMNGNVAASNNVAKTDRGFVETWIGAPFHAGGLLDPQLVTTGFGSYRRAGAPSFQAAATLDVLQGRTGPAPIVATKFPGDLSILPLAQLSYRGGESPDPLTPCPGYNPGTGQPISTGLPLFALLPNAPAAGTVTATLTRQGSLVESCVYDETSYTNPNPDDQTLGQQVLAERHQVVVVPRAPLVSGSTYAVSVASMDAGTMAPDGASWSFSTKPEVSIGNASIVEGQSKSRAVRLTVSLSGPSANPVTVDYATLPGTATPGSDYVAKTGTVTFAPGATAAAISIPVKGDLVAEANETFSVKLSSPQGADIRRGQGSVSILTDDRVGSPTTGIRMSIGGASIVEGNATGRALRFTVGLSDAPTTDVSVHYAAVPGTATAGSDFGAGSGNLTIPAGTTSGVILIKVKGDAVVEPTEAFTVQLSAPVGAVLDRATGTGSIMNDD